MYRHAIALSRGTARCVRAPESLVADWNKDFGSATVCSVSLDFNSSSSALPAAGRDRRGVAKKILWMACVQLGTG